MSYVLHLWRHPVPVSSEDARATLHDLRQQLSFSPDAAAGQLLEVKVKPVTVKSDLISEAIIATAKRNKCDLIVMASHGRRGIKRLLLGSETQQVLTHSHIPVLVLR